ncbi:MAG: pilus assembly protein TadG-related protein [Gaiellales bacterium]
MNCGTRLLARLTIVRDEAGQALVLTVMFLVLLLGFAGLALDVGHAYLVQRQLQAGVDAAALAGAQDLPDAAAATTTARDLYGPTSAASPNHLRTITGYNPQDTQVTISCLRTYGCVGRRAKKNGITVKASANVSTWFARLLGHDSFTVHATSTACSPCSTKGFDVMIVLDRTGSMCTDSSGHSSCADLDNAKNGIRQFLKAMDPGLDKVGLAVLPPVVDNRDRCAAPFDGTRNGQSGWIYGYNAFWPSWQANRAPVGAALSHYGVSEPQFDYLAETSPGSGIWEPSGTSQLVQTVDCIHAAGSTSYGNAIIEAKYYLDQYGNGSTPDGRSRGNAQDVIVFLTDGAPNVQARNGYVQGGINLETYGTNPNQNGAGNRPCDAGIAAASWVKPTTLVYTIGFGLLDGGNQGNCGRNSGLTPQSTLEGMATTAGPGGTFYATGSDTDLGKVFEQIASDIRDRSGQLVPDNAN